MDLRATLLISFLLASPFFLFLFHCAAVRLAKLTKQVPSNQKLTLYCIIAFNAPILACARLIAGPVDPVHTLAYAFMTYNGFAYCYFHFFNMSETARRIRILVGVKGGNITVMQDLEKFYDYESTLSVRLKRLEQLSQIKQSGGAYSLDGSLLYRVSGLVVFFRKLLGFEDVRSG
ncbi:MAG TPA: hypothetical protein PKM65_00705 [Spirochaetota bacterium]|nr:hypothetical protein [Spirochaetota bacterium]HNT11662.1 hypothetical protein [Spirochaetota bacterium]